MTVNASGFRSMKKTPDLSLRSIAWILEYRAEVNVATVVVKNFPPTLRVMISESIVDFFGLENRRRTKSFFDSDSDFQMKEKRSSDNES